MDSFRLWQEDYRREVEEVIAQLRASGGGVPARPADMVIPPAGTYKELLVAQERLAKLVPLLQEAKRRLDERGQELTEEARRREELKNAALKLHFSLKNATAELEDARRRIDQEVRRASAAEESLTAALQQRDMAQAGFDAAREKLGEGELARQALQKRLQSAVEERARLSSELDAARARVTAELEAQNQRSAQWGEQTKRLEARINELQELVERRGLYAKELQDKYDASVAAHEASDRDRAEGLMKMAGTLETARDQLKKAAAAKLAAEQNAQAERAKVEEVMVGLRAERDARAADAARWMGEREGLVIELDRERERRAEVEASFQEALAKLEDQRKQNEASREEEQAKRTQLAEESSGLLRKAQAAVDGLETLRSELKAAEARAEGAEAEARRLREAAGAAPSEANRKMDEVRAACEKEMADLQAEHKKTLDGVQERAQVELDHLRAQHKAELTALRLKMGEELRLAGETAAAVLAAESKRSDDLKDIKALQARERQRIEDETNAALDKAEAALSEHLPPPPAAPPTPAPEAEPPKSGLFGWFKKGQ